MILDGYSIRFQFGQQDLLFFFGNPNRPLAEHLDTLSVQYKFNENRN